MEKTDLVKQIHKSPYKCVIITTGGGSGIFPDLLEVGGGSATLIFGHIPYGDQETIELLGGKPDKFVSEQTARQLAMAAYQMALKHDADPVFGVACSSSLQKTPTEREGREHCIYAALQTGTKTISMTWKFTPSKSNPILAEEVRYQEEKINTRMLLNLVAEGCELDDRLLTYYDDKIIRRESGLFSGFLPELLNGKTKRLVCYYNDTTLHMGEHSKLIFPGSFNPAHEAHLEMADKAESLLGRRCDFELSIRNVDKPLLDFITIEERLKTIPNYRVWLTNTPTFTEKSNVFPYATFVVGYDTAERICDPKYGPVESVLDTFEKNKTRFIVFGRVMNGELKNDPTKFPIRFQQMATFVDEPVVHSNLSSTEIRSEKAE